MRGSARRAALVLVLAGIWISTTVTAAGSPAEPPSPAMAAYTRGQEHLARRTEADLSAALQDFERATAADATFAPAFAGLAETQALLFNYSGRKSFLHA